MTRCASAGAGTQRAASPRAPSPRASSGSWAAAGHANARHRNTDPASATTAPATRSATSPDRPSMAPHRSRCRAPWRQPVATTNPTLYVEAALAGAAAPCRARGRGRSAKTPTSTAATTSGGSASQRHHEAEQQRRRARCRPRRRAAWTPTSPRNPPNAITIGKVTGSSQTAGGPSCAPQRPTATIASTWSSPETGCSKPGQEALAPARPGRARRPASRARGATRRGRDAARCRPASAVRRAAGSSQPRQQDQRALNRPVGARAIPRRSPGSALDEPRPADLEHAERALEQHDHQQHERRSDRSRRRR